AGGPPADPHHVAVTGRQVEPAEVDPPAAVGALVDVDGLVAAAGHDHVRRTVVVTRVRWPPGVHVVLAGGRDVDPVPGRVAGEHRVGEVVVGPVLLAGVGRGAPVLATGEPGGGGVDDGGEAATAATAHLGRHFAPQLRQPAVQHVARAGGGAEVPVPVDPAGRDAVLLADVGAHAHLRVPQCAAGSDRGVRALVLDPERGRLGDRRVHPPPDGGAALQPGQALIPALHNVTASADGELLAGVGPAVVVHVPVLDGP